MTPAALVVSVADVAAAVPSTPRVVEKPRYGIVAAGAVTFGAPYVVTAGFASLMWLGSAGHRTASQGSYYGWMLMPGVGPWISLAYVEGNNARGMTLVAVTSGSLQTIGLGLVALGLFWKRTEIVKVGPARVLPWQLAGGGGLLLSGEL